MAEWSDEQIIARLGDALQRLAELFKEIQQYEAELRRRRETHDGDGKE